MNRKIILIALVFILLIGGFLRFFQITEFPLGLYPDEAMNGNNALEALATGEFKTFYPENNGREGLYMNMLAAPLWAFGNEPWAVRGVSAVFGVLTILGVYLLTKELFRENFKFSILNFKSISNDLIFKRLKTGGYEIALLSSFFLASSYWHINFARIGFRGILVPFFATFGLYFLLKGLRGGKILDLVWAGIFIGLGFHTYIAFRFMPFVLLVPLLFYLWRWWKKNNPNDTNNNPNIANNSKHSDVKFEAFGLSSCTPCAVLLFLFITFVVALPIGVYFLQNPGDFVGRAADVSIFSAESPAYEFVKSNALTWQMFFWQGDCNWRHNYNCEPQLYPIVAVFFAIGLIVAISMSLSLSKGFGNEARIVKGVTSNVAAKRYEHRNPYRFPVALLLVWLLFMSLPATLTREGLPHALRAIGMIPPVMIFAGFGAWWLLQFLVSWFEKQKAKFPDIKNMLSRIQRELGFLLVFVVLLIPLITYHTYFLKWAQHQETFFAFTTDTLQLGQYLNNIPDDVQKIVLVNRPGVLVRGTPMPAQPIMFATNTFPSEARLKNNILYTKDIGAIALTSDKALVTMIDGLDRNAILELKEKLPEFREWAPGAFTVFQNY